MNDFYHTLLGEMPTGAFWAYFAMAMGGFCVRIYGQYLSNSKKITDSGGFQKSVWLIRNWPRLVFNPVVIILGIVLYKDLYGQDITPVAAGLLGLSSDEIIDRIKGFVAIKRGKK